VKKNGKHETSRAWIRASKRDSAIAAIFAGLDSSPKRSASTHELSKESIQDMTKQKRGGAREGAGRKPNNPGEPMKNHAMRWTDAGWADVLLIGMDRVRELVAKDAKKVRASDSKKQSKTSEKDIDIA
jgi:hypothetical protein